MDLKSVTRLTNVPDPILSSDSATKGYVDAVARGLNVKQSVSVAADSNVDLTSPVSVIDGVTLQSGDRVLLMGQTLPVQNGIFALGTGGFLARTLDCPPGTSAIGIFVFVDQGTYAEVGFIAYSSTDPCIVGTDPVEFSKFSGTIFLAGMGLEKDGITFNVNLGADSGLSLTGGTLQIDPSIAGSGITFSGGVLSSTTAVSVGTLTTGVWNASTVGVAWGGTGITQVNPMKPGLWVVVLEHRPTRKLAESHIRFKHPDPLSLRAAHRTQYRRNGARGQLVAVGVLGPHRAHEPALHQPGRNRVEGGGIHEQRYGLCVQRRRCVCVDSRVYGRVCGHCRFQWCASADCGCSAAG
ncbi:uncharacterized protein BJ171DRAFT_11922 [Polychytrium aggregatum]|uniref:uncharacterized protein n=1 Tax=Polychytrium aggregatum TaxID=110093 RepID=UPI0022FE6280|nr:uncharacterized protein BJ171DRAFT_11922 [Polychytrium aggregatum]KAI9206565.1 hypothetical protein BJ171DRAFT_11922 [Polychytrium aggregatum]